jgi:sodium-dependent dicarboxylate transporter 2/3/5
VTAPYQSDEEIIPATAGVAGRARALAMVAVFAGLAYAFPLPGVSEEGRRLTAIMATVATLWVNEVLPLAVTALLGPALAVVVGVAPAEKAFNAFGSPIIMVFVGSFLLARATFKHRLNERIAYRVLSLAILRNSPTLAFVFLGLTTAALSAWMSNVACTAMMLPIAQSVLLAMSTHEQRAGSAYAAALMLVVTYSASVGGLFTPIGTPPNLIGLGLIEQATGTRVSFLAWVLRVFPITCAALLAIMGVLAYGFRTEAHRFRYLRAHMVQRYAALGPWKLVERRILIAWAVTITLWLLPPVLSLLWPVGGKALGARMPEAVVPLCVATVLFWLRTNSDPESGTILQLPDLGAIDWPVIVLFGGGMCLGELMIQTGLARALGQALAGYVPAGDSPLLVVIFSTLAIAVSEATSNTAAANMVIPVVMAVTNQVGGDAVTLGLAATAACTFGFMLPVSTPTNAMAYATGYVTQRQMIRSGIVLDIIGVVLLSVWFGWIWR